MNIVHVTKRIQVIQREGIYFDLAIKRFLLSH